MRQLGWARRLFSVNGAEIEALAGSNPSFAAWEQNEAYTIALLIKGRSGGAGTKHLYRSNSSSKCNHILWLSVVVADGSPSRTSTPPSRRRARFSAPRS